MANATINRHPIPDERASLMLSGQGLISQNFERTASAAGLIMVDGTAYFMAVPLLAGDVVSSVSIAATTVGAGMTLSKVGLYALDGTRLAVSADLGAGWEGTDGTKTGALTAPYTVPTSGLYYAAIIGKTGTTMPTLLRGLSNTIIDAMTAIGSGACPAGSQTGQTDLPASATITPAVGIGFWVGVS